MGDPLYLRIISNPRHRVSKNKTKKVCFLFLGQHQAFCKGSSESSDESVRDRRVSFITPQDYLRPKQTSSWNVCVCVWGHQLFLWMEGRATAKKHCLRSSLSSHSGEKTLSAAPQSLSERRVSSRWAVFASSQVCLEEAYAHNIIYLCSWCWVDARPREVRQSSTYSCCFFCFHHTATVVLCSQFLTLALVALCGHWAYFV